MDLGIIVDLETTGLDPKTDRIIEIGILAFAVGDGAPPQITGMYSGVEDPGQPLSAEVAAITGLSDAVLAGRRIHWETVREHFSTAVIAIAHNAAFDSAFLRGREELRPLTLPFACSMKHIDWEAKGFRTRALNYLACDHGFINPFPHRALFDCATTFRLVAPHISELATRCYLRDVHVAAVGAPFDKKDLLRNHRYRWDNERRVWHKQVLEDQLVQEREFLRSEIYTAMNDLHEETFILPGGSLDDA